MHAHMPYLRQLKISVRVTEAVATKHRKTMWNVPVARYIAHGFTAGNFHEVAAGPR